MRRPRVDMRDHASPAMPGASHAIGNDEYPREGGPIETDQSAAGDR